MIASTAVILPFVGLIIFCLPFVRAIREQENNWVKLGLACQVFMQGPAAIAAFDSLQAASSARLFIFIGCTLGCAGSAALLCQMKAGAWQLSGAAARNGAEPT